jgi:pimeloyl-ACP methyl ester carboxylesterase
VPFLDVGGRRIEYAWHGPPPDRAPTIVFLHEGLGCVAMWRDFPARVAAATGLGALVYSRPGYGASDPVPLPRTPRYLHEEALDVLPAVLAAAGVGELVLYGHSDGGSIALIYAGTPELVPRARLVMVEAPHVFTDDVRFEAIEAARVAYEDGSLRVALERHHGANTPNAFRTWNETWLQPGMRAWSIEGVLPSIGVPVLAIQGEHDEYATLRQLDAIAAGSGGPVTRLVLPCGHRPHRERSDEVIAAIVASCRHAGVPARAL